MKKVLTLLALTGLMACETRAQQIGEPVDADAAISVVQLDEQMTDREEMEATVAGTVEEVCQAKGCWMTLRRDDGSTLMVKFKDYALFMPKDLAGKEVVMRGVARQRTVPVSELRHYAEDAGKSDEEIAAITEPETGVGFTADGVLIQE